MFHRGFKHSKTIKALGLRPRAFISFLVFETPMKHSHSFLKYYLKADVIFFSPIKLVSLRELAPSRNAVFNQTGMDFVTEISFCKTPVVDEKRLVFRG